ncbi:ABC-type transport system involved in multi-copper enzyme maturation permease subunit [Fictibacillus halophilus]|uniref:ABC-type transport system involved in multi-copper enzyme maturation permease subunit n=1 Tax=Fictibacillus halophilus TaxID=1610490 RepID=A0ABV2LM99_9BACL|nr:ABC transporter permease subunit [Fictibacillus halophilus]
MFHKALWMRNQKLGSPAVWGIYISLFLFLPYSFFGKAQTMLTEKNNPYRDAPENYYLNFHFTGSDIVLFLFLIVGLAALLVGSERTSHATDLTFSLPFKRKDIFLSKWIFGVGHIITSLLVNLLVCMLIVKFTILSEVTDAAFLFEFMMIVIPFSIAIFSFSLFIGTVAGSLVSQLVLSGIFLLFPLGFLSLVVSFLENHGISINHGAHTTQVFGDLINSFTLPIPIIDFRYDINLSTENSFTDLSHTPYVMLLIPLAYTILSVVFGTLFFSKTKNENNGRLLVFEKGRGFFTFGVVLCFALTFGMLGGEVFGDYDSRSLIGYYLSAALGGVLAFFMLKKLIHFRMQFGK